MQKQIWQSIIPLLLAIWLAAAAGCSMPTLPPATTANIDRQAQETLLSDINYAKWSAESLRVSPDNRRVAYLVFAEKGSFVVVDGKEGTLYQDVVPSSLVFSKDSKQFAYVAEMDNKWFVVVNGQEGKQRCDVILPFSLQFNPSSQKETYVAQIGDKWFLQTGDNQGKLYDEIQAYSLAFSPDGKRVAYAARESNSWFVVDNEKDGKKYDEVMGWTITFSPDGQRIVYGAVSGKSSFVVIDGVENKPYVTLDLGKRSFSPDGKRFAYVASSGDKGFVVLDGKELKPYWGIGVGSLLFSPDSRRLAYGAQIKGHEEPPAGKAKDAKTPQKNEDEVCVVVDEQEGKVYNLVGGGPVFSPDSKRVAYFAWEKGGWFPVIDRQEYKQKQYEDIAPESLIFSPDGKYMAFGAKAGKWSMVVNGNAGKAYDGIVALLGTKVDFDSANTLSYIAVDGSKVYLVEEKITEKSAKP